MFDECGLFIAWMNSEWHIRFPLDWYCNQNAKSVSISDNIIESILV